jgi:hypothetical protein
MAMKHSIRAAVVVAAGALSTVGFAGIAHAAPGDNGNGVGGCTAGNFYGNTTNPRPGGNGVLPSQSPGPFVNVPPAPNEPPRNDRTRGLSIGEAMVLVHDAIGPPAGNYTGRDVQEFFCTGP